MSQPIELTDSTFADEVLKSERPVLVDYWAPWCGPCKTVGPIVDEVAASRGDDIKVGKLNVDENNDTMVAYGIRGIPTLMLFKGGEAVASKTGAVSKAQLDAFIDQHI